MENKNKREEFLIKKFRDLKKLINGMTTAEIISTFEFMKFKLLSKQCGNNKDK